jgi:hypothetical protein
VSTLHLTAGPGPVDPHIQVTGYVQGEPLHREGGHQVPTLIVHTTGSLWPLVLDVWAVAAALHCADAQFTADTNLDQLAHLVVTGVQVAGWLRVGSMGCATQDIGTRLDTGQADTEDHLMLVEAWGDDARREACCVVARVLCTSAHTEILRELPGHGHCPTLAEVARW